MIMLVLLPLKVLFCLLATGRVTNKMHAALEFIHSPASNTALQLQMYWYRRCVESSTCKIRCSTGNFSTQNKNAQVYTNVCRLYFRRCSVTTVWASMELLYTFIQRPSSAFSFCRFLSKYLT